MNKLPLTVLVALLPVHRAVGKELPHTQSAADAKLLQGDILAGVNAPGRALIAIDERPVDGDVDAWFLFAAPERLAGPQAYPVVSGRLLQRQRSSWLRLGTDHSCWCCLSTEFQ